MKGRVKLIWLVIFTMLIWVIGTTAGCKSDQQPSDQTTTATTTAKSTTTAATTTAKDTSEVESRKSYTFKFHTWYDDVPEVNQITEFISQQVGHEIKMQFVTWVEYGTQLNILNMTNELPDVLISCGCAGAAANTTTAEITADDIKNFMPKYWARFVELQGGEKDALLDFNSRFLNNTTGKVQGIPRASLAYTLPHANLWRADIIEDELGMSIPETLAECEAVFAAFKAKYPDKYPVATTHSFGFHDVFVSGAYGISTLLDPWQMIDGELHMPQYTDYFKKTVETLARWYERGFIDPEYIVNTDQQVDFKKFRQGDIILTNVVDFTLGAPAELNPDGFEAMARELNPNARVAYAILKPEPEANQDKYAMRVWTPFPGWQSWIGAGAGKDKDPDRFAALLGVLDQISSTKELYMTATYGIEGTHYEINQNGVPEFIGKFAEGPEARRGEGIDASAYQTSLSLDRFLFEIKGANYQRMWDLYASVVGWNVDTLKQDFVMEFGPGVVLPEDVSFPEGATVYAQVHNFITGSWPMSRYDEWLEEYKVASGYETVRDLAMKQKYPFYQINLGLE